MSDDVGVTVSRVRGGFRVAVTGELDVAGAVVLLEVVTPVGPTRFLPAPADGTVVLDVADADFMDAVGLRGLLAARTALAELGWRVLLDLPAPGRSPVIDHAVAAGWVHADPEHADAAPWQRAWRTGWRPGPGPDRAGPTHREVAAE